LRQLFVCGNFYRKLLGDSGIASSDVLLGKAVVGLMGNVGERDATDGARLNARRACGDPSGGAGLAASQASAEVSCFQFKSFLPKHPVLR
jgi:hypothetical protein